jgi:hypothetical protein
MRFFFTATVLVDLKQFSNIESGVVGQYPALTFKSIV